MPSGSTGPKDPVMPSGDTGPKMDDTQPKEPSFELEVKPEVLNTVFKKDFKKSCTVAGACDPSEFCVIKANSGGNRVLSIKKSKLAGVCKGNKHLFVELAAPACQFPAGTQGYIFSDHYSELPEVLQDALKIQTNCPK
jgi:hypothetical protein